MKIPRVPHSWNLTPSEAIAVQKRLAARVSRSAPRRKIRTIAGVDCAFSADGEDCLAAAVVWHVEEERVIEERIASQRVRFPYVPGLLTFRESPAVLAALRALKSEPDALMVDGHGLAHPRRFGIACHLGVLSGLSSIGVAKSRLCGEHREPGAKRGSRAALTHHGERIATVLRSRDGVRPIFVSIGNAIDLASAERLVLRTSGGFRLPEPTRLADRAVARAKREGPPVRGSGR